MKIRRTTLARLLFAAYAAIPFVVPAVLMAVAWCLKSLLPRFWVVMTDWPMAVAFFGATLAALWGISYRRISVERWDVLKGSCNTWRRPFGSKMLGSWRVAKGFLDPAIVGWVLEEGLLIQPSILFRFRHPRLLLPWTKVIALSEREHFDPFAGKFVVSEVGFFLDGITFYIDFDGRWASAMIRHLRNLPNFAYGCIGNSANQRLLPTPANVTPAAGAPVAPSSREGDR